MKSESLVIACMKEEIERIKGKKGEDSGRERWRKRRLRERESKGENAGKIRQFKVLSGIKWGVEIHQSEGSRSLYVCTGRYIA